MKKALLIILSAAILLCACGTSNEVTEAETQEIQETQETQEMQETTKIEMTSVTISNNSPYDEGESNTPNFDELLASENGIEIYGENNITIESPADGMWNIVLRIKNNNDFQIELDHGSNYDVNDDNFSGSLTNYCRDFTAIVHPNDSDFLIEPNGELQMIFDISYLTLIIKANQLKVI